MKMLKQTELIVLLMSVICITHDSTGQEAKLPSLEQKITQAKQAEIEVFEDQLLEARQALKKTNRYTAADVRKEIAELESKLRRLRSKTVPYHLQLHSRYPIGSLGQLPSSPKVIQVIDDDEAIVQVSHEWEHLRADGVLTNDVFVYIQGLNTQHLVDGKTWPAIAYSTYFVVKGTKKYQTVAGGSKTVPLLEPYWDQNQPLVEATKQVAKKRDSRRSGKGYGISPKY